MNSFGYEPYKVLFVSTLAFILCFAVWMLNGVLVTFLVEKDVYDWSPAQIGLLLGIPVLSGSLFRLPMGILTDKFGGKPVFISLLLFCSLPLFLLSAMDSYTGFLLCSLAFGVVGASFTIATAYTSVWFPLKWQGLALGIVGAGNAGAGITTLFAPTILENLTKSGTEVENWRMLPFIYATGLVFAALLFIFLVKNKKPEQSEKNINQLLQPLKKARVWRFGLYYFLVFGCFVAFAQWLVPYFVNMYSTGLVTAGIFASIFSIPSGLIRILGGWLSDKVGARKVMYWTLGSSFVISAMLIFPRMEIITPGPGVSSQKDGVVSSVSDSVIVVDEIRYHLNSPEHSFSFDNTDEQTLILPARDSWHTPIVKQGDTVRKKELLSKGTTRIYFQANIWVSVILIVLIGSVWGIGKAAVYKHIPEYFPGQVGVVGGMVGVLGGLGGFACPLIFGYLLQSSGFWTSSWVFILFVSGLSLFLMNNAIRKNVGKSD